MNNPHLRRDAALGIAFALISAIGFSGKAIFVKLAYLSEVDAVTLLALRMAFSVPVFIGVALWAAWRHETPLTKREHLLVIALGIIGYYLSSLFDFLGLQYISAGLERLILFLYPTMTVVLLALLYRQAIVRKVQIAIALSYGGIALVFVHDAGLQGENTMLGASLVFLSTLTYSLYLVGAGHAIARIGTTRFTSYAMIIASLACVLQFLFTHPTHIALELPARVYWLALAMAAFSTVLPVFMLSWAIRHIGTGNASLVSSLGPASTIFMAWLFLGEHVTLLQIIGSILVLAGVLVVSLHSRKGSV
ncbi:MAG: DMT family transporter [Methylobacillus sp.]|jgi:drug/metabolite transporter (DMT)-like permease|nr:DMT family transporter [Methylobacillus sp.]